MQPFSMASKESVTPITLHSTGDFGIKLFPMFGTLVEPEICEALSEHAANKRAPRANKL
jgi:hypothetical protein